MEKGLDRGKVTSSWLHFHDLSGVYEESPYGFTLMVFLPNTHWAGHRVCQPVLSLVEPREHLKRYGMSLALTKHSMLSKGICKAKLWKMNLASHRLLLNTKDKPGKMILGYPWACGAVGILNQVCSSSSLGFSSPADVPSSHALGTCPSHPSNNSISSNCRGMTRLSARTRHHIVVLSFPP